MTQLEVTTKLTRLRFVGGYSYGRLAKEAGLSPSTIRDATGGKMSQLTQTRLEMLFRQLPDVCPKPPSKRKPGTKKMLMIRYLNLRYWLEIIEQTGRHPPFVLKSHYPMKTQEEAGYVCTKLDYMLKYYLLREFGFELNKKGVFMGDCYAAENWIDRIQKVLPNFKKDLIARLQVRRGVMK